MTRKQQFVWEIYFLIVLLFTFTRALHFFSPESPQYLYFHILQSFDPLFLLSYTFNLLQVILNIIHLLPFLLYIYRIKLFPEVLWQILFTLKVLLDLVGHPYELNLLLSLYRHDPLVALSAFLTSAGIYIPVYIALFVYAFNRERLQLKNL